jgi:hypothetical protein
MSEMSPAEAIFFAALGRPPADRAAFLDAACAGDAEPVKRRVAVKLIHDDRGSQAILARFEAERQAIALTEARPRGDG